jgi:biopolymer transport protein ExbD
MKFYLRKRRQVPAVIIVALIDVLIVLLIFLIVTTTFKQQPALRIALPESSQSVKTGATEDPPLVVSIDPKGGLRYGPESRAVSLDGLMTELNAQVVTNPGLRLAIAADTNAPVGQLVKIIDASKAAKIKSYFLFTKEIGKRP